MSHQVDPFPLQTDSTLGSTEQLPTFYVQPKIEKHTKNTGLVHDAIIGLADGLTVPFALTAGLSSYVDLSLRENNYSHRETIESDLQNLSFWVVSPNSSLVPSAWVLVRTLPLSQTKDITRLRKQDRGVK